MRPRDLGEGSHSGEHPGEYRDAGQQAWCSTPFGSRPQWHSPSPVIRTQVPADLHRVVSSQR
jgi:hypothetical protein